MMLLCYNAGGFAKSSICKARELLNREAYCLYVERLKSERNAADGLFAKPSYGCGSITHDPTFTLPPGNTAPSARSVITLTMLALPSLGPCMKNREPSAPFT